MEVLSINCAQCFQVLLALSSCPCVHVCIVSEEYLGPVNYLELYLIHTSSYASYSPAYTSYNGRPFLCLN